MGKASFALAFSSPEADRKRASYALRERILTPDVLLGYSDFERWGKGKRKVFRMSCEINNPLDPSNSEVLAEYLKSSEFKNSPCRVIH